MTPGSSKKSEDSFKSLIGEVSSTPRYIIEYLAKKPQYRSGSSSPHFLEKDMTLWRTLIDITRIERDRIIVKIPGWDPGSLLAWPRMKMSDTDWKMVKKLPMHRGIRRCHAKVRLGAERFDELDIQEWEDPQITQAELNAIYEKYAR